MEKSRTLVATAAGAPTLMVVSPPHAAASAVGYTTGTITELGTAACVANDPPNLTGVSPAMTATGITGDDSASWNAGPADGVGDTNVSRVGLRRYIPVGASGAPSVDFAIESLTAERSADGVPSVTLAASRIVGHDAKRRHRAQCARRHRHPRRRQERTSDERQIIATGTGHAPHPPIDAIPTGRLLAPPAALRRR